jgi:hypothetical protein
METILNNVNKPIFFVTIQPDFSWIFHFNLSELQAIASQIWGVYKNLAF